VLRRRRESGGCHCSRRRALNSRRPLQVAHERLQEQAQELEAQAEELAVRNAELEEQARELARLDRTRSDFMATISHELRTPLNAIIGYSDLLVEGVPVAVPESARKHAARIRLGADHLLRLIEEILTFSSLEAGRQRAIMEDLDTRCLVDELQAVIEPLAEQRGLEFRIDTGAAPATLRTDPNRLRQILLNLLANAVKFTDEGHIELEAARLGDSVVFFVRDTGIGIRAEEQRFLFEPFWQADQTHTRRMQGAGLGLAIADRLTTLLGGSITVTSTVGEGTEFCLRVPLNCTESGNPVAAPQSGRGRSVAAPSAGRQPVPVPMPAAVRPPPRSCAGASPHRAVGPRRRPCCPPC
jgi:signal transduction histidine kinase